MLSPSSLSTHDRLIISLGHILAVLRANKPETAAHIVLVPAVKTTNNKQRDPLAAAEPPPPAQLDGPADC